MEFKGLEEFDAELADALDYYDEIDPDLAIRLIKELRAMKEHLSTFPEASPLTQKPPVRKYLLKDFPYRVRYVQEGEVILLLSIDHLKRNKGM